MLGATGFLGVTRRNAEYIVRLCRDRRYVNVVPHAIDWDGTDGQSKQLRNDPLFADTLCHVSGNCDPMDALGFEVARMHACSARGLDDTAGSRLADGGHDTNRRSVAILADDL